MMISTPNKHFLNVLFQKYFDNPIHQVDYFQFNKETFQF